MIKSTYLSPITRAPYRVSFNTLYALLINP